MDYSKAYKDMRDVFDHPCIQKAIEFAAKNPAVVYGKDTQEYKLVIDHGFFDLYFSVSLSTAEDAGA